MPTLRRGMPRRYKQSFPSHSDPPPSILLVPPLLILNSYLLIAIVFLSSPHTTVI